MLFRCLNWQRMSIDPQKFEKLLDQTTSSHHPRSSQFRQELQNLQLLGMHCRKPTRVSLELQHFLQRLLLYRQPVSTAQLSYPK